MTEGPLNSFLVRVVPRLIALIMRLWFLGLFVVVGCSLLVDGDESTTRRSAAASRLDG